MTVVVASMPNFRDVGGRRTAGGGHLRTGVLFRSDQIAQLNQHDAAALTGIGLRYVYDLRTEAERVMLPGERIAGATHVSLDVLADDRQSMPARLLRLFADPGSAESVLGDGRGAAMFVESYRSFVRLPSARAGFRQLYEGLAGPEHLPAMLHCTTGKDRTGWACAALQLLLGVPQAAVLEDYLESNPRVSRKYEPHLKAFAAAGGDPSILLPVLSVRPEYLEAAIAEARRGYGSIEGYFRDGLGVGDETVRALRQRLVAQ
jgi:protein-tyrosine phosphatase